MEGVSQMAETVRVDEARRIQAARLEALQGLRDSHDAFRALQELIEGASTPTVTVDRRSFSALLQVLNTQLDQSAARVKSTW